MPFQKPMFRPDFHVEILESEGVFLLAEQDYVALNGRACQIVAPYLSGGLTVAEIIERVHGELTAAEVHYLLLLLDQKGLLVEASALPPREAAFWSALDVAPQRAATRLANHSVALQTVGPIDPQPFIAAAETAGLRIRADGDYLVVLTDDYLRDGLATVNKDCLANKRPFMLVKPVGVVLWMGPIVEPHRTGCWCCLAHRLRANRPAERFVQQVKNTSVCFPTSRGDLSSTRDVAIHLAITEIKKWIVCGRHPTLDGAVVTFDTVQLRTESHRLVRRPQCPVCGEAPDRRVQDATPIVLQSRPKRFTTDGGYRTVDPAVTWEQHKHQVSPITGVVHTLRRATAPDDPHLHAYTAGHNFATSFDKASYLRSTLRSVSGGKGMTDLQARVGGLCEAIERYSGLYEGTEIRQRVSFGQLANRAIHPNACMGFSPRQYDHRVYLNAHCHSYMREIPEPFDEEEEIEWTPLWSLTAHTFKHLPTAYCYYGYPAIEGSFCRADSNGNAAGNTVEEAILQGFMELVERDGVAVWWYNRVRRPAVDLDSFEESYFDVIQRRLRTLHRDLWVLDVTNDLKVPAFVAVSARTDRMPHDILFGFGAHLDPRIGVLRAITELIQFIPAIGTDQEEGLTKYKHSDPALIHWLETATLDAHPYLRPDDQAPRTPISAWPCRNNHDLLTDVTTCVEIARQAGLETLVLDQTRPDIGLNVVKVVVPGLRHFWKRLGPGRLYDVPVTMGWLETPRRESEMNPIDLFL